MILAGRGDRHRTIASGKIAMVSHSARIASYTATATRPAFFAPHRMQAAVRMGPVRTETYQ